MTIDELLDLAAQAPGWRVEANGHIRSDCGCPIAAALVVSGRANRLLHYEARDLWNERRRGRGRCTPAEFRAAVAATLTAEAGDRADMLGIDRPGPVITAADTADCPVRAVAALRARMLARFGLTEAAP